MAWRARRSSVTWALALVLGVPALAEAQLFPNAPIHIRRQRPPCETEPPYFKFVRQQYYGYFPTCWRRWPDNWECPCPNPEKPTPEMWAESFRKYPLGKTEDTGASGELGGTPPPDENSGLGGGRLPEGPGGAAPGGANPNPPALPGAPPDLFDRDPNAKPDAARPNDNPGAMRMPTPADLPGAVVDAPSSGPEVAAEPASPGGPAEDPAMTTPTGTLAPSAAPMTPNPGVNLRSGPARPPAPMMGPTARAPQRRSLLSRLFGDRSRRM